MGIDDKEINLKAAIMKTSFRLIRTWINEFAW